MKTERNADRHQVEGGERDPPIDGRERVLPDRNRGTNGDGDPGPKGPERSIHLRRCEWVKSHRGRLAERGAKTSSIGQMFNKDFEPDADQHEPAEGI